MAQVASYVIGMQSNTPANPKAAEGTIIWPTTNTPSEAQSLTVASKE